MIAKRQALSIGLFLREARELSRRTSANSRIANNSASVTSVIQATGRTLTWFRGSIWPWLLPMREGISFHGHSCQIAGPIAADLALK